MLLMVDQGGAKPGASAGLSRLRREFLLSWQKEPKPLSPTQSGAVKPHRCPALLATRGTAPKLATLRQGRLFGPAQLRCSARFKATLVERERQQKQEQEQETKTKNGEEKR
ncbi:hypothetical protein [Xanthomonas campestris]|uniref:hypothetical protein n=1 Tax=Xanthomonas campestris TaxID=339 RepID=UPI00138FE6D4|nr:hypothetical protein [Xanthomonas campestris]MCF8825134.1 hypothetical protein [Xanthomonas campestris pv. raphani]MEA9840621.1 hypothetical protein [Xanthomonas campestris pv. raphani]MEA9874655.1 hypothetical protein [Xanthomonas campestris pv. raphani]MEA9893361.1 hypothetical protein [Xanthomonas campestris pv. raphani]MEA9934335.1 hypothetical protein [Xanthomonas campestris pv. raphani]